MRVLVVGAGAIGGYFGGRLLEAGRDVTFLVRPRRAAELARTGLVIRSQFGDVDLPVPPMVTEDTLREPFDIVLLSCKAYDLDDAMAAFAPAVGPQTVILPLLNGIRHLDALKARFGANHVLGGQCLISAVLDPNGHIVHLSDSHSLSFGERDGLRSAHVEAIAAVLSSAGFEARPSEAILQEMWEKWVFIATAAGITCLMRASVGDIVAANGAGLATALLEECAAIAARAGFPPRENSLQRSRALFTTPGSGSPRRCSATSKLGRRLRPTTSSATSFAAAATSRKVGRFRASHSPMSKPMRVGGHEPMPPRLRPPSAPDLRAFRPEISMKRQS
jgi:2-dehydropantoate 2-reductase